MLIEAAGRSPGLGIDRQEDRSEDRHRDQVGCSGSEALKENLVRGFFVDQNIKDRCQKAPADDVRSDLIQVESQDIFAAESAVFNCALLPA